MSALAQVRTTRVLAAARWRGLRSPAARAATWSGFGLCLLVVSVAAKAGDLVREVARLGIVDDSAPSRVLAFALERPQALWAMAVLGAAAVGLLGALGHGSVPRLLQAPYGALVRTGTLTRYMESVAASAISVVPAAQLTILCAAGSILTADGEHRPRAILTALGCTVALLLARVALSWASHLASGARRARAITGAGIVALAGSATLTAEHLSSAAWWLLTGPARVAGPVLGALVLAAAGAGLAACRAAANTVPSAPQGGAWSASIPASPAGAARRSLALSAWRAPSVRSSMLIALCASLGLALVARDGTASSLALIAPLAFSLSFSTNFLAAHGRGALWLAALPRVSHSLAAAGAGLALAVPSVVVGLAAIPVAVLTPEHLGPLALTAVPAITLLAGVSVSRALRRPIGAGVHRGAPLVGDSLALVELARLSAIAGLVWVATTWPVATPIGVSHTSAKVMASAILTSVGAALLMKSIVFWPRERARALAQAGTE